MLTLRQFGNELRRKFPSDRPIKVRTTKMPYSNRTEKILRDYGDTQDKNAHYLIRINKDSDLSIQKDTLMHEWAHCLAGWDNEHNAHSREWGIWYSKIYRAMIDD